MKIIGVNGSARKDGNTEIVLKQILQEAAKQGAITEYVVVDKLNFGGCKGCMWCQQNGGGRCVQKDDMLEMYDRIASADAIVLASPVYFSTMSGQLKSFIDRLYPFYGRGGKPSRLPKAVTIVLVFTQGQPNPQLYSQSFKIAADALRLIGFNVLEDIFVAPGIPDKGDIINNKPCLDEARLLAQRLYDGVQR